MEPIENELDLHEIINILMRRWWIVILVTIVAALAGIIMSFYVLDTVFEASTTLMVNNTTNEETVIQYNDVLLNQKLVKTYGVIVKSYTVLSRVMDNLSLEMGFSEFQSLINVTSLQDTEIIKIGVTYTNPIMAARIANELARVFQEEVQRIMKIDNVQVIDEAMPPARPVKPNHKINIAVAFVLGIVMGVGFVFILEYFDNSIKTEDDVNKYLQLPVIGAIPDTDDL